MNRMHSLIRRAITTAIIRLGPNHQIVLSIMQRQCGKFGVSLTNEHDFLRLQKDECEMRLALRHFAYAFDMAKHFEMYFRPLRPTKIGNRYVLDYSKPGALQTYSESGLQFQLASIPEEEIAIDGYFHWYIPKYGDTIFDIGAHCGVSTYHFSKAVGTNGRVVAFEPDPLNFTLLVSNIERHKLENVTPVQLAIAGVQGTASFNSEGAIGSGLSRNASRSSAGDVVIVKTVTLEEAFRQWGPPDFCKIDIEGSEIEVISAARPFLQSNQVRCDFAFDTNHLLDGALTDKRIEALFREIGYQSESSESDPKTTWARPASQL
jgi:FkbM family methyltransferase